MIDVLGIIEEMETERRFLRLEAALRAVIAGQNDAALAILDAPEDEEAGDG